MKIEITNLRPEHEQAVAAVLQTWQRLGAIGASRWVALFADGDGSFRPKIEMDVEPPSSPPIPSVHGLADEVLALDCDAYWSLAPDSEEVGDG